MADSLHQRTNANITAISRWIDRSPGYALVDDETALWRRCTKPASEAGEVIDALAGVVGENPRKGQHGTMDDVVTELLDVAAAALGAVVHIHDAGHIPTDGAPVDVMGALAFHIDGRRVRAGLEIDHG